MEAIDDPARLQFVLGILEVPFAETDSFVTGDNRVEPAIIGPDFVFADRTPNCDLATPTVERICCCGTMSDCPFEE